ncbi:hypothetical protein B0H19DRAFT_1110417 [Mycena capillaripes]|nr:hypothetical protein B0H19DRAFT_1110417 [Mycena capillaripes]
MSIPVQGHVQEATADTMVEPECESSGRPSFLSTSSERTAVGISASPPSTPRSFEEKDQRDARPPIEFVPPRNDNRCLILCFDGTGDQFDADNSNIVQLVSALKKDDRMKQMVYYQSGIGTYTSTKFATPFATKISLTLDAMIAWNLDSHVMAGYEFLMQNYTANDRICIFGFSRGAYIARSLAGMIHKVGLLPVDNHQQVPFAYRIYTRADATGWAQSNAFKRAFSNHVHIDFIGVWDTVDSVGLIPKRLPFTTSNTIVRTFRHAVSLDERRAKFKANLWNFPNDQEKKLGTHTPPETPTIKRKTPQHGWSLPNLPPMPKIPTHLRSSSEPDDDVEQTKYETEFTKRHHKTRPTDVLEVWFAGCHCDVGGGSVSNDTRNSLARIPLRWMIRETFKANTGIMFDAQRLQELGLDPQTLYPFVLDRPPPLPVDGAKIEPTPRQKGWLRRILSRKCKDFPMSPELENAPLEKPPPGMEEAEDLKDALCPIYDQLKLSKCWWLLELIPLTFRYQRRDDDQWITEFRSNLGQPRKIPHQRPHEKDPEHPHHDADHKPVVHLKVHRSVQTRRAARDAKGRCYVNRAKFHCEPQWVD